MSRPTPIEIADEVVDEYQGAYPAELSEGIAEAIQAERAEADRRVQAEREAIVRWLRTRPEGSLRGPRALAKQIERGEHLKEDM